MDQHKKTRKEKRYPRVPIKTYKWEDIRRSRRRGGYPWTHLYKQPFNEQLDPEPFTMSALRKSKSSSTVEKAEGVQICDVTENEEGEEKMDSLQIVTEPDDRSARNSIGSIVIEECDLSDVGEVDIQKPENAALESADSSDNISQYLDKEERGPTKEPESKNKLSSTDEGDEDETEKESQNVLNEEQPKRKRKISAESSHSRISSTKEAVLKKLKDTKDKIKVPKITFNINKLKRPKPKPVKNVSFEPKKEPKKQSVPPKDIKPVYIHIPLKPPPGQTDEFSYLEFEEKPITKSPPAKTVGSFKFLAKNIKRLQESLPNEQPLGEEPSSKFLKKDNDVVKDEEEDEVRESPVNTDKTAEGGDENVDNPEIYKIQTELDTESKETLDDSKNNLDVHETQTIGTVDRKSILKKSTDAIEGLSAQPQKGILKEKHERAKSEEPEKRRKLSLESSYSRKSLSKLEIMKRLKETSEKIKKTFSINRKKKQPDTEKTITPVKETPTKKPSKSEKREQPVKPVYIYIPLKPENEEEKETMPEDENSQLSNTPESPVPNDVQFIILTAPSDDEILDYHSSDVPETPSESQTFFDNKIDELKKIAKDAVNDVTPSAASHVLDPVTEETSNGEKITKEEGNNAIAIPQEPAQDTAPENISNDDTSISETPIDPTLNKPEEISDRENITIDVEDGLSESCKKDDKQESSVGRPMPSNTNVECKPEETHLNLQTVPVIKKKVSFKRRSKPSKDGSYEDISSSVSGPQDQVIVVKEDSVSGLNSTIDKIQLDSNESVAASIQEDDDKWSKISDHEYEPVNPPPEVQTILSFTPTINIVEEIDNTQSVNTCPEVLNIRSDLPVKDEMSHSTNPLPPNEKETISNISVHIQPTDGGQNQDVPTSDKNKDPNKFQLAWKQTADQFKTKLRNIKKPQSSEVHKTKSRKFKFEKPKFNLPKIPDTKKINLPSLPSFNLTRKNSTKRSQNERQESTESNVGDSKKISFDFSTYPRVLKKKLKFKSEKKNEEFLDLATTPQSVEQDMQAKKKGASEVIRVPLHSEESVSDENVQRLHEPDVEFGQRNDDEKVEYSDDDHMASHIRYKDDIDIDDEFESQEINHDNYLSRWNHGNFNTDPNEEYAKQFENSRFQVTDLDFPEHQSFDYNSNHNKERYSSGSSFGGQRIGGVLEEINPDEFFLRQKGISQDNIEVGMYLSSEIKEAFRTPENALSKMEDRDYNYNSNQSLPESPSKRKPIKKPKRKKTPHVSQERISLGESDDDDDDDDIDFMPPSRPKRRSKRVSKTKHAEDIIPYQETIPLEANVSTENDNSNIINEFENDMEAQYVHDRKRLDNPEFNLAYPEDMNFEYIDENQIEQPAAPPRKHKSLKSLTSENESILAEISPHIQTHGIDIETSPTDTDFITPPAYPLRKPSRKKSRTSLQSGTSLQSKDFSQKEDMSSTSQVFSYENQTPCVEEPCFKDIRDSMGYAIIDKQKPRDPPLPPPRSLGRKKRSTQTSESNFFTVPRQSRYDNTPVRPLRNYSTLSQTKKVLEPATYENKENIDITQYIEIEDEHNRDLQSGDVIRKMKHRPLPAPPRPPRKSRVLQNITSKENIMADISDHNNDDPDDNEELDLKNDNAIEKPSSTIENNPIEKRLIVPEYFTYQETVTHGSLLVQSLDGHQILRDSDLTSHSNERIIPVSAESDDETSSVPEEFKNLKDPPEEIHAQQTPPANKEIEVLKAQKLQVVDLDVDTLTVNKLLAGKIIVSEIDSHNIKVDEINSKVFGVHSAEARGGGPKGTQDNGSNVFDQSQELQRENVEAENSENERNEAVENVNEKKTSTGVNENELLLFENIRRLENVNDNKDDIITEIQLASINPYNNVIDDQYLQNNPPEPPPRSLDSNIESISENTYPMIQTQEIVNRIANEVIQEPDVDDEPPPRPPQPHLDYIPSQPPASFYALRAQKYIDSVDSNIPKIPRRKRRPRSISRSSSEDSLSTPVSRRLYGRTSEPSISQLSGQLIRTCGSTAHSALKRLITNIIENVKKNSDGKLDLHVMTIILLILIAGLILLGYGEEKTVVHLHHWEYFNPPKDL